MKLVFDRGTIVLLDPAPDVAAWELPGALWDPRVGLWRAPGYRYRELRRVLRTLDSPVHDTIAERFGERRRFDRPDLRPYQLAALMAWRLAGGRGLIAIPTGGGKTRVAVAVIAATGLPAICLVPTRVLMHQWVETLTSFCPAGTIGRLGDGCREIRRITVATFESAWRRMDRIGGRFGLLIVDEAHHFGAGARDEALEMSAAPFRLALTATPPEEAQLERLEALVGPIVFRRSVDDLVGIYLAEYERITLHLALTKSERREYEREMHAFREVHRVFFRVSPQASWQDFAKSAGRSRAGRAALASLRRARRILSFPAAKAKAVESLLRQHRGTRVLLFTTGNEDAYRIARTHLIMPITCDIGRHERADALDRFRRGELRALVSARVLNEGIDVPDAGVAIIVGGSHGVREHVQRIGRVLRPAPGKRALVYELVMRGTTEVPQARRRGAGLASEEAA